MDSRNLQATLTGGLRDRTPLYIGRAYPGRSPSYGWELGRGWSFGFMGRGSDRKVVLVVSLAMRKGITAKMELVCSTIMPSDALHTGVTGFFSCISNYGYTLFLSTMFGIVKTTCATVCKK